MKILKIIFAALLVFQLIGCKPETSPNKLDEELKPAENQNTSLFIISKIYLLKAEKRLTNEENRDVGFQKILSDKEIGNILRKDEQLSHIIKNNCIDVDNSNSQEKANALVFLAPIIAAAGKLTSDLYLDNKLEKHEQLKKKAQATYSGNVILPASTFRDSTCALLVRSSKQQSDNIGLKALFKFNNYRNKGFTITPIYVDSLNAMALTRLQKDKENKTYYPLDIAIGIALKSIGIQENTKLPKIFNIGEGSIAIGMIKIGEAKTDTHLVSPYKCEEKCGQTDLIPYPVDPNSIVSVSISIAETGNVGVDFDKREAQLKALKEAIGPALSDAIKELLKEDD